MIEAKVSGIPDLRAALAGIVPKLRVRALRNALAAGARAVQKSARAATPVISSSSVPVRKGYRTPGTVRKAISVRTSKLARRAGNVGVFVNVRPAKRGARGAKNPKDPFYWKFIEFGTQAHRITAPAGKVLGFSLRKSVQIPAQSARPFVRPTWDRVKTRLPKMFADDVLGLLKKHGLK